LRGVESTIILRPRTTRTGISLNVAPAHQLVISCEHGGHEVPDAFASLFEGRQAVLESHRGWDPGALELARRMAGALGAPLHAATTTRLLIDLNRSIGHRQLFSEFSRPLPAAQRAELVERFYRPHRDAVEGDIDRRIAAGARVLHIASHSFTPTLAGVERRADLAWLYDPRRATESAFAIDWQDAMAACAPGLRLRRNYPYQGRDDGLASALRRRHPASAYLGLELEVNQGYFLAGGARWEHLCASLVESLARLCAAQPAAQPAAPAEAVPVAG
jgi:predicted N-formylglutamate amidohydrolase